MFLKILLSKKRNKQIIGISASIILLFIIWTFLIPKDPTAHLLKVPVKKGWFEISIITTGELEAKNNVSIEAPRSVQELGIYQVKIQDIVPNGTFVKKGDYIATLDKSVLLSKIKELKEQIDKQQAKFTSTKLDTTINLKSARNDLLNQKYGLEEIEIELEQSVYESPSTIRQLKIKLDKAKRAYIQAKASYKLKVDKAVASINEVYFVLKQLKDKLNIFQEMINKFTIYAPKDGMVVHPRAYGQDKNIIGRQLNLHNPVVAQLPNLSKLISITYVNEIDISKVKKGQNAIVSVDAFPSLEFEGIVTDVANMGNRYMSGNAKLFEVRIELKNANNLLKPSMTTKNKIITNTFEQVKYLPLECIHNDENGSYVFTKGRRKQVIVGEANTNEIIILEGLEEGDPVCINSPDEPQKLRFEKLDPELVKKYEDLHKKKNRISLDKNQNKGTYSIKKVQTVQKN